MTVPISELFDLGGKVALVTGGSKGIGQSIAFRLAEAGAKVMIAARDLSPTEQTVSEIKANGGIAQAIKGDVGLVDDVNRMVEETVRTFGGLDILVNNAGFDPLPVSGAFDTTEEIWQQTLDINLKGAFFCCQAASKQMVRAGKGGKIILVSSIADFKPKYKAHYYNASKGAVNSLTRSLALELAPHKILVNAIAPGGIYTPMAEKSIASHGRDFEYVKNKYASNMLLGRWGEPDEVARVALFLASQAADYLTGSMLIVDGGVLVM